MICPIDQSTLLMSERNGIEIDYCPQCRGVWLDRGELDKILERMRDDAVEAPLQSTPGRAPEGQGYVDDRRDPRYDDRREPRYDDRRDPRYGNPQHRKKKSPFEFLGDLFEG